MKFYIDKMDIYVFNVNEYIDKMDIYKKNYKNNKLKKIEIS